MSGARRRGRPRTAWMDNIKTWMGLSVEDYVEESIRMTEDMDEWRKYTSMVWPTLGSRTAKEQNRTALFTMSERAVEQYKSDSIPVRRSIGSVFGLAPRCACAD